MTLLGYIFIYRGTGGIRNGRYKKKRRGLNESRRKTTRRQIYPSGHQTDARNKFRGQSLCITFMLDCSFLSSRASKNPDWTQKKKSKKGNKRNAHILAYGERKRDGPALLLVDYFINRAIKEVSPQSARLGQRKETAPSIKQQL